MWQCNYCLRVAGMDAKGELISQTGDLLATRTKTDVNIGAIADLASMFMEECGGMREFVRGTVSQLYAAEEADPGCSRALNMRMNIAKLFVRSAEVVEQVNDVGRMSDAELAGAIERLARSGVFEQLVSEDPNDHPTPQLESPTPAGDGPLDRGSTPQEGAAEGLSSPDENP
jgi:hypothetical protein